MQSQRNARNLSNFLVISFGQTLISFRNLTEI